YSAPYASLHGPRGHAHRPELAAVEDVTGDAGRLRPQRRLLPAVAFLAIVDAGDQHLATGLRGATGMAVLASHAAMRGMVEARVRQEARAHHPRRHDRRRVRLWRQRVGQHLAGIPHAVGSPAFMAIGAAAAIVEDYLQRGQALGCDPS